MFEPGVEILALSSMEMQPSHELLQSELPRPSKIRSRMYVRRSIMYENAEFCSPEEYCSVAQQSVPLKFVKLCFLEEFYLQVNKAYFVLQHIAKIPSFQ